MTSTTLLSDVVLPAATWDEKHDLSLTDTIRSCTLLPPIDLPGGQDRLRRLPRYRPAALRPGREASRGAQGPGRACPSSTTPRARPSARWGGPGLEGRGRRRRPRPEHADLRRRRARLHRDRRQARRDRPAGRLPRLHGQERHLPRRGADRSAGAVQRRHAGRCGRRPDRRSTQTPRWPRRSCASPVRRTASSPSRASEPSRSGWVGRSPTSRMGFGGETDQLRRHPGRPGPGDHLARVVGLGDRRTPYALFHGTVHATSSRLSCSIPDVA